MDQKGRQSEDSRNFREKAERTVQFESIPLHRMSGADIGALFHELRVREAELKMRNEELREIKAELEQSRRKYADLFDFSPIGHFVFDTKGCIAEANLTGAAMLRTDRRDLNGGSFNAFVAPQDRDRLRQHLEVVFSTGEARQCEVHLLLEDQSTIAVRLHSRPMTDANDEEEARRCHVAMIDITHRKQAEQAMREAHDLLEDRIHKRTGELQRTVDVLQEEVSERIEAQDQLLHQKEILQRIIDNIPVMLCFYDADGNVLLINEELHRVLGYTREDFQNNDVMERCYPDPAYRKQVWDYMIAAEPGWREFQVQSKTGDGVISSWANVRFSDGSYVGIGIDIRQRKQYEERIKESEERYRTLVELSPDGIGVERDGTIQYVNATAARLLGAERTEDLTGKPILDFVHPNHRKRTEKQLAYLRRRRKPLRVAEAKVLRLDGTILHVELSGIPIAYESRPATQIVMRDITQRRKAQERLGQNAAQLQEQAKLLNLAHDTILVHDLQGRLTFWNQGAERTYGWTKEEALGQISHELLKTRFPESLMNITAALLRQGQWNGELKHTSRSGQILTVSSRWALQRDENGVPTGILEIDRDITQRKQAEQASSEARRFAESVIETIQEALMVLDTDLKVLSANRSFYHTFQVTPEETEGRPIYEIGNRQWDLPDLRNLLEDILPHNSSFDEFEVEHDFERIGHRVMLLNARRVHQETQETGMILLAIQDITVRKQQEQEILASQRQLAELTEELLLTEERERRRIATALHDSIGQSLAFSKRTLGVLRKDSPESLWVQIEKARQQIDKAIQQTRSLTFELSPATLYTFGLEAALEELAEQFSQREGLQCHLEAQDGADPLPEQTKVLLYRSARELLTNVAKHAGARNVSIRIGRVGRDVRIEIEDDGKGFEPSELQPVQGKRMSFGLFSIRERVAHMKGSFDIQSRSGHGTKVMIQVPVQTTQENDSRSRQS